MTGLVLAISYVGRQFTVRLYNVDSVIKEANCTDASTDLISCIDLVLENHTVAELDKITFLSGPGSLTGSRIVCATCLGIRAASKVPIIPVRLDFAMSLYSKCPIILSFTSDLAHVFQNDNWELVPVDKLILEEYITDSPSKFSGNPLPWPDLCEYVKKAGDKLNPPEIVEPFYGALDLIKKI